MPSKRKRTKNKQTKSKSPSLRRRKKSSREELTVTSKKTVGKKQSKKKTLSKGSPARKRKTPRHRGQRSETSSARKGVYGFEQSRDLEGLSGGEQADSESVTELVEEGNVFEAGVVAGVQEADDQDTREVHTHEFPEDDVPEEYLDKD